MHPFMSDFHHHRERAFCRSHGAVPGHLHQHMAHAGGFGGHHPEGHHGSGRGGGGHGGHGGRHGRGGRMFEQGAIKILALNLVAERPCYGYELIKYIETLVGGDYSPSPGVIYPTLTYLVDMGWATVTEGDAGRKQYTVTAAGLEQLERVRPELDALLARLKLVREGSDARRSPDIERAMNNLKAVLHVRFSEGNASPELARKIAALIDEAALGIQKLEVSV
ncbi:PadR family transcriptional regulator [Undibacterium luofuense]|uniref:PadR family transcriptional regulator n=1 Tax=Undibacterium luofuense TaxID=2828733 RepID=UPI0030EE1A3D